MRALPGWRLAILVCLVLALAAGFGAIPRAAWADSAPPCPRVVPAQPLAVTCVAIYARGLINPKQMAFTADGSLYVAEAGKPNSVMVPLPVNFGGKGPVGTNARISRIPPGGGHRLDFVTGLPNIGLYAGVEMLGASGMAVMHGQLYEVAAGHITVSPKLSRVTPQGKLITVADLGAFNNQHAPPPVNGDAVPLGNPYGMAATGGNLYITDGNYNRVLKVTPQGGISILNTFALDPTSTGIAVGPDGALYVAQFGVAPYNHGSGQIDRMALDGKITPAAIKNLTTPVGITFAPDGTPYVLQYAANFSPQHRRYLPYGGSVLRVNKDGSTTPMVTGLMFPDSLTFGPDGALYVANYGNESSHGEGQILRIVLGTRPVRAPSVPPPSDHSPFDANSASPPSSAAGSPPAAAKVAIIEPTTVTQWGYAPKLITIHAGDSVTFTNTGRIAHTVTSSTGAFDTGLIQPGASASITFSKPGTFSYYCQPHPWMKATIVVLPAVAGSALKVSIVEPTTVTKWGYAPAKLTIRAGQSVTFTNTGRIAHTVTSSTGAFDTGLIQPGASASLTFSKPGTFSYYCQPHPWMKGIIVVEGAAPAATPAAPVAANTINSGQPPSVNVAATIGGVALIILLVFAAAFALRRRPAEAQKQRR